MFPDTVEVNFSLTVDPHSRRGPGFNDELKSTVMVYAFGNTSSFGQGSQVFPDNTTHDNPIMLGRFEAVTYKAQTLECVGEISFINPYMQIQSSFVMNWTSVSQGSHHLNI